MTSFYFVLKQIILTKPLDNPLKNLFKITNLSEAQIIILRNPQSGSVVAIFDRASNRE
jgi:hypothetical protein